MLKLKEFKEELNDELHQLLSWWKNHSIDKENSGFYGKIDNNNQAQKATKGLVLNTRILYTFSSAYSLLKNEEYLQIAERAYKYLIDFFYDKVNGGFYWSLNNDGSIYDSKKQVYGQAFVVYGLVEYYKITAKKEVLQLAKETYRLLERYSFDMYHLGYLEAHDRNWKEITNLKLSEKDQNDKKSMNTHLHIIEAYSNLYSAWPDDQLKNAISLLLSNFKNHIINQKTSHLDLFFDEDWTVKSSLISFGHDIEASWLLLEAATIIKNKTYISDFQIIALKMAGASMIGLQDNGGLLYEYNPSNNLWHKEYHWWPQAEAMVGFFNVWQTSSELRFLTYVLSVWEFIKSHLKDKKNGEWFWGLDKNLNPMLEEDKAGFWKCPYHNGRACIELIKRINQLEQIA